MEEDVEPDVCSLEMTVDPCSLGDVTAVVALMDEVAAITLAVFFSTSCGIICEVAGPELLSLNGSG